MNWGVQTAKIASPKVASPKVASPKVASPKVNEVPAAIPDRGDADACRIVCLE